MPDEMSNITVLCLAQGQLPLGQYVLQIINPSVWSSHNTSGEVANPRESRKPDVSRLSACAALSVPVS